MLSKCVRIGNMNDMMTKHISNFMMKNLICNYNVCGQRGKPHTFLRTPRLFSLVRGSVVKKYPESYAAEVINVIA